MLGRLPLKHNGPVSSASCTPIERDAADVRDELKLAVDLVCDFNDKLGKLTYGTREIVHGWLRERF